MEAGWNEAEEKLIVETMASGPSRIEAIQRLRSSWKIGETPPPMWPEVRPMPKENSRHGQTKALDRPEALTQASFPSLEASTATGTRLETMRLPKVASMRQARWRAKKKLAAAA